MRKVGPRSILAPLALAVALLGVGAPAEAGFLVNGDFSQGLTGWTTTPADSVSVVNQVAILSESTTATEVDLFQDFTIPTGATTLTFTLASLTTEPASSSNFPDAFGASLLKPTTLESLVPTVNTSTDSFYTRDLVDGVTQGLAAPGVTLSPSPTSLPLNFTVDVSSLGGKDTRILFRLIGGGDSFAATVGVTNVSVTGAIVPEPGSLVLLCSGFVTLVAYAWNRRSTTNAT
jgi:hypothetical protein